MSTSIPAHVADFANTLIPLCVTHTAIISRVNAVASRYVYDNGNMRVAIIATADRITSHKITDSIAPIVETPAPIPAVDSSVPFTSQECPIDYTPSIVLPTESSPAIPAPFVDVAGRRFTYGNAGEFASGSGEIIANLGDGWVKVILDDGTCTRTRLVSLHVDYSSPIAPAPAPAIEPIPVSSHPSIVGRVVSRVRALASSVLDSLALATLPPVLASHPQPIPADYAWLPAPRRFESFRRFVPTSVESADA